MTPEQRVTRCCCRCKHVHEAAGPQCLEHSQQAQAMARQPGAELDMSLWLLDAPT